MVSVIQYVERGPGSAASEKEDWVIQISCEYSRLLFNVCHNVWLGVIRQLHDCPRSYQQLLQSLIWNQPQTCHFLTGRPEYSATPQRLRINTCEIRNNTKAHKH